MRARPKTTLKITNNIKSYDYSKIVGKPYISKIRTKTYVSKTP